MKETKKSIPIIKTLIIFSVVVFICSVIYISFFKEPQHIPVRGNVVLSKDSLMRKAIDDFTTYVNARPDVPLSRKYVAEAFMKLQRAVTAIAKAKGYEFQFSDLIIAESDIERIASEKTFSTRAYYLKHAAEILSNSLRKIQRQKFPVLADPANELRAAAARFTGTDLKLDQDQKIKAFLSKAAYVLKAMR